MAPEHTSIQCLSLTTLNAFMHTSYATVVYVLSVYDLLEVKTLVKYKTITWALLITH